MLIELNSKCLLCSKKLFVCKLRPKRNECLSKPAVWLHDTREGRKSWKSSLCFILYTIHIFLVGIFNVWVNFRLAVLILILKMEHISVLAVTKVVPFWNLFGSIWKKFVLLSDNCSHKVWSAAQRLSLAHYRALWDRFISALQMDKLLPLGLLRGLLARAPWWSSAEANARRKKIDIYSYLAILLQ